MTEAVPPPPAGPFWKRTSTVVVALILFPPAGLVLLWIARPWSQRVRVIASIPAALWALGFLASAVGSGGSSHSTVSASASAASTPPSPAVAQAARSASPAAQAQPDSLTAYGATRAAWNAHHREDPDAAPGSSYDRTPGLAYPDSPRFDDRYFAVGGLGGDRILNYSIRFAPGTPRALAFHFALGELPPDAQLVWQQRKDTCYQQEYRSPTLDRILGPNTGVLFEYSSGEAGDHYDPRSVSEAIVIPNPAAAAPGDTNC